MKLKQTNTNEKKLGIFYELGMKFIFYELETLKDV